ncbi:cytochrome P450 2D10-like isoform X2 [Amblyomma americanum]
MAFGTLLVASTTYLLVWLLVRKSLRLRKLPPGANLPPMPPTSSFLGHMELSQPDFPSKKALEWASQYGPVFRLRQYFTDVVLINDWDSMKKFFCKNQLLHRPNVMTIGGDYYQLLVNQSGDIWTASRSFFLKMQRNIWFSKPMEKRIAEELRRLSQRIAASKEEPLLVEEYFLDSFVNIKASLVKQINDYLAATSEKPDCEFIRAYLKKVEEAKGDPNPVFQYRYLVGNINSVILGGIFGPTRSIVAHMVLLGALRHRVQDRVQQEIDEVIGASRTPTWEDRKRMPFTMACIWEMERWNKNSGFDLPRTSAHDILVDDVFIPKGTVVILNQWAVNNNPSVWKNPHLFDPTRYLMKDGTLFYKKPENHVGFSVGKRSCPGEPFALMEIFLMVTFLLQRYHVVLGQPLDFDVQDKNVAHCRLEHVKLRFVPRCASKT